MQHYTNTVTNYSGDRVVGAVATVTDLNGVAASLYADFAGTIPIGYQVTTDTHGVFSFYAAIGRYNIVVSGPGITTYSITDVFIGDVELVARLELSTGSSTIGHIATATGAVARTVQSKLIDIVSVKDFGAVGNGVTDDTAAINLAINAINTELINQLYFPAGTYRISGALAVITSNGACIYGDGPRVSVISQNANADVFSFSSTTPNINRCSDISIANLGIDIGGLSAPSSGLALNLNRVDRAYFSNLDIRSCYQGILITGGADIRFNNLVITGAYSWSALASGSFLLKITQHVFTGEIPGEIFIDNYNIKGAGVYNGAHYLSQCVVVECCDGLFISNGHFGFSYNSPLFINPQTAVSASIQNIEMSNSYADGNAAGNTSTSCVLLSGSVNPAVAHIKFDGCVFKNFDGHGVNIDDVAAYDVRFNDCQISENGAYGIIATGIDNLNISGCFIYNNNGNNSSSNAINLSGVNGAVISGNIVRSGANPSPVGLNIGASCSDIAITSNVIGGHTVDYATSVNSRIKFTGNVKYGSDPTVISSDGFIPPLGYSFVTVTGNTNFSNIGGPFILGNEVTLQFSGTPTAFDAAGNIKLAGNFVATAGSVLTMVSDGTTWVEKSRAIV